MDDSNDRGCGLVLEPSNVHVVVSDDAERSVELPLRARLINNGAKPLTLVMPGDGSLSGWRTPIVTWSFAPSVGDPPARCGNITALAPGEVFTLQVGESRELPAWLRPSVREVGVYRAHMTYRNEPSLQWTGEPLGDHDAAEMARVRSSSRCRVRSNEVTVTVERR